MKSQCCLDAALLRGFDRPALNSPKKKKRESPKKFFKMKMKSQCCLDAALLRGFDRPALNSPKKKKEKERKKKTEGSPKKFCLDAL